MNKISFLPEWYYEKNNIKKNKVQNKIIIGLTIINIIALSAVFYNNTYEKNLLNKIKIITSNNKEKVKSNNLKSIENLNILYKCLNNKYTLNNLYVDSKNIEFVVLINEKSQSLDIIKRIESLEKFKILELFPLKYEDKELIRAIKIKLISI